MSKNDPIYVDESIYRTEELKDFSPTGYRININHPAIRPMYKQYKENHGYPLHYPISDKQRFIFEQIIFNKIEAGSIVVKKGLQSNAK